METKPQLVGVADLAVIIGLPYRWILESARAGLIPGIRVGTTTRTPAWSFDVEAVKLAIEEMTAYRPRATAPVELIPIKRFHVAGITEAELRRRARAGEFPAFRCGKQLLVNAEVLGLMLMADSATKSRDPSFRRTFYGTTEQRFNELAPHRRTSLVDTRRGRRPAESVQADGEGHDQAAGVPAPGHSTGQADRPVQDGDGRAGTGGAAEGGVSL